MRLISLSVARPHLMVYKGVTSNTGIFKKPVASRIALRTLNLDGDRQADLSVHGGPYKAVYGYPFEHYEYWRQELPEANFPWGAFGENFTTEGLGEEELHVGDRFRIGSAVVMVRQPFAGKRRGHHRGNEPAFLSGEIQSRPAGEGNCHRCAAGGLARLLPATAQQARGSHVARWAALIAEVVIPYNSQ